MRLITVNRSGITRTVFLIGSYAIKVPCLRYEKHRWRGFLRGILANMQEQDFDSAKWPELCPIVYASPSSLLIVMRRATPLTAEQWEAFESEYDTFVYAHGALLPVERKADSFGMLDGRVVAVDYGGFAW